MFYYEDYADKTHLSSPKVSELKKQIESSCLGRGDIYRGHQLYAMVDLEPKYFQGQKYYTYKYERCM